MKPLWQSYLIALPPKMWSNYSNSEDQVEQFFWKQKCFIFDTLVANIGGVNKETLDGSLGYIEEGRHVLFEDPDIKSIVSYLHNTSWGQGWLPFLEEKILETDWESVANDNMAGLRLLLWNSIDTATDILNKYRANLEMRKTYMTMLREEGKIEAKEAMKDTAILVTINDLLELVDWLLMEFTQRKLTQ